MGKSPAQEMKAGLRKTKEKIKKENISRKEAINDDKAFGLKNKKGGKQALNVDRLRAEAARAGRTNAEIRLDEKKKAEAAEIRRQKKQNGGLTDAEVLLGKSVVDAPKVAFDPNVDPKTIVCAFYKKGTCKKKGNKCKFSHDLSLDTGKGAGKRNMYIDPREADTMDKWDQDKLELVVSQKDFHRPNATKIVCKYFIDSIEDKKYGWFWKCPNGKDCLYQHKLPPGFVLKCDIVEVKSDEVELDMYEKIDLERSKLDTTKGTPITEKTFKVWKEKQRLQKIKDAALLDKQEKLAGKNKARAAHGMSGRQLFALDPSLFEDDADAAADGDYEAEEEDEGDAEYSTFDITKAKEWTAAPAADLEAEVSVEGLSLKDGEQ